MFFSNTILVLSAAVAVFFSASVVAAPPSTFDLTGYQIYNQCTQIFGTFTSGTQKYSNTYECVTNPDGSVTCDYKSHFNWANAKVAFDDGSSGVVTLSGHDKGTSTYTPDAYTSEYLSVQHINYITKGTGVTQMIKVLNKCTSSYDFITGIFTNDCKPDKFEFICN